VCVCVQKQTQSDPVVMAARIPVEAKPPPHRSLCASDYAGAKTCLAVRWVELILWAAIMKDPRRDVGICASFAKTLASYSMQLLPQSILPYSMVPMTRLDPLDFEQKVRNVFHRCDTCVA